MLCWRALRAELPTQRFAFLANAVNSCVFGYSSVANAHAVPASSYGLKLPTLRFASLAYAMNNC